MAARGKFGVLEGGEGSGKSTQAERLSAALDAVQTREPGGTAVGTQLREVLLGRDTTGLSDRAEALLMAADRAQHVAELVEPALAAGRHVVCDRFLGSSVAYQGYGRMLPLDEVREINQWAVHSWWPELVVLIEVDPALLDERMRGRDLDRFEREGDEFHARVRAGFADMATADPHRWVVVDGNRPIDDVEADIVAAVVERLGIAPA